MLLSFYKDSNSLKGAVIAERNQEAEIKQRSNSYKGRSPASIT